MGASSVEWHVATVASVARKLTHVMKYLTAKTVSYSLSLSFLLKAKKLAFKLVCWGCRGMLRVQPVAPISLL